MSLATTDQLREIVRRAVPRTRPSGSVPSEKQQDAKIRLRELAKKNLRDMNAGR